MLLYYTYLAETVFPNVYSVIVHLLLYFACVVHSIIPLLIEHSWPEFWKHCLYNTVTLILYTSAVKQHWDTIKNMKIVDYLVCMTQDMCSLKNHKQLLSTQLLSSDSLKLEPLHRCTVLNDGATLHARIVYTSIVHTIIDTHWLVPPLGH